LAWRPPPRQELVDALAEADLAHRQAETRDLEAKTALALRQAPLEEEERRAHIAESEARTIRVLASVLAPSLLLAAGLIATLVDPGTGAGIGIEVSVTKFSWWSLLIASA
jgi:hypothetical protein